MYECYMAGNVNHVNKEYFPFDQSGVQMEHTNHWNQLVLARLVLLMDQSCSVFRLQLVEMVI